MGIFTVKRNLLITYILFTTLIHIYLLSYALRQINIFSSPVIIPNTRNVSYMERSILSVPSVATLVSRNSCNLSLIESDGWFCDSNDDWKRRKQIHRLQDKRNRNSELFDEFFIWNWEPTVHCGFEQRIGNAGDGGKWVCDIHHLQRENFTPLIYSFGSNGKFDFEQSTKEMLPKAEIHTFDMVTYECPLDVCTFHQATIGDGINGTKSLNMVIDELGHRQRQIDILKIDIERSEYVTLEAFFKQPRSMTSNTGKKQNKDDISYIRQILMEIHLDDIAGDESARRTHELFELFRFNNYAIFHKEPNLNAPEVASEYAFIRLNPKFFI